MGYYTSYDLSTEPESAKDDVRARLTELHHDFDPFDDDTKWYDWRVHCFEVSKEFPKVMITISGDGEETGDLWRAFFHCGRMQLHRAPKWSQPDKPTGAPWEAG